MTSPAKIRFAQFEISTSLEHSENPFQSNEVIQPVQQLVATYANFLLPEEKIFFDHLSNAAFVMNLFMPFEHNSP